MTFFLIFVVYHWLFPPRLASKNPLRETTRLWLELRAHGHNKIQTCDPQPSDDFWEIKAWSIWKPCSTTFVFCSSGLFERWPSCEKTRFTSLHAKASCSIQPFTFTRKPNSARTILSAHAPPFLIGGNTKTYSPPVKRRCRFYNRFGGKGHSTTSVAFLSQNKWSCSRQIREKECYHKCKREYLQAK